MLVREPLDLMPKKTVSRIMPHPDKMAQFRRLGWVGRQLFASDLWHLNRRTVALAFLNGIFWACMPIPLQMIAAAMTALVIRCNVPISLTAIGSTIAKISSKSLACNSAGNALWYQAVAA